MADRLKRQFMNNRISDSKNDPRGLWKNLKTLLPGKKQSTISSLETKSGILTNDTEIADAINNFFATIGQNWQVNLKAPIIQPHLLLMFSHMIILVLAFQM